MSSMSLDDSQGTYKERQVQQPITSDRPNRLPILQGSSQDLMDGDDNSSTSTPFLRHQKTRNAHSKAVTTATGNDTHGALNQHPAEYGDFSVGVQDAQGARMTMEDAYSFVVDFASIRGQGFFAIFDGHAGPEAAEWCGNHFHEQLLVDLKENPTMGIPDVLNKTFLAVDTELSGMSSERGSSSGCTAVTAFLRIEDAQGSQNFVTEGLMEDASMVSVDRDMSLATMPPVSRDVSMASLSQASQSSDQSESSSQEKRKGGGSIIKSAVRSIASPFGRSRPSSPAPSQPNTPRSNSPQPPIVETSGSSGLRRVLYTANAGDARAVLCRGGKALRLTYDHKGADRQEAKRIQDAGGFVLNNRVNGVLAVTRSLGDSSMKEFVVGSPYTTETPLGSSDEFLILACDGLWDVASDQQAVDLIRDEHDANSAAKKLMNHALEEGTRDNVTVLVVRFNKSIFKS